MEDEEELHTTSFVDASLSDLLQRPLPHPERETLEFQSFLAALQTSLARVLSTDVASNAFLVDDDGADTDAMRALRALHRALVADIMSRAEFLGDVRLAQCGNGWTLLMVAWCVAAHCVVVFACARADAPPTDVDETTLDAAELITTAGGLADVPTMSMSELRLAIDVLRDRFYSLDTLDGTLMRYVLALEARASDFVVGRAVDADYDVLAWLVPGTTTTLTAAYLASMAWYFATMKRHLVVMLRMAHPNFFATTLLPGALLVVAQPTRDAAALAAALERHAGSLGTKEHKESFSALSRTALLAPGDVQADSYEFGMAGIEQSTLNDVLGRRRTLDAVAHIFTRKYKRSLLEWWRAGRRRLELTGGRLVGGGAASEAPIEQLAVFYIINSLFVARLHIPWAAWFLLLARNLTDYERRVRTAINAGLPFIVQRLGWFACIVPPVPESGSPRAIIEARLGIVNTGDDDRGCVMYDARDALDALAIWLRFMHDGWNGRIHHAPSVRLRPIIGPLLR